VEAHDTPSASELVGIGSRAQVLLLGTFHFKDAGLDAYKPEHELDILSESVQVEICDLVERLSAFQPTKVGVERRLHREQELSDEYQAYCAGELVLPPSEVYQLGFRIARRLGHSRLYPIDAVGRSYEALDFESLQKYASEHGQEELLDSPWQERYTRLYTHDDALKLDCSLREHILYINSEERLRVGHGHYLVGPFEVGSGDEYPGVDFVTGWWYNRNLRIFARIQRITDSPDDRLLIIIGAGHVPILRHLLLNSPEHQLVEPRVYLE